MTKKMYEKWVKFATIGCFLLLAGSMIMTTNLMNGNIGSGRWCYADYQSRQHCHWQFDRPHTP